MILRFEYTILDLEVLESSCGTDVCVVKGAERRAEGR